MRGSRVLIAGVSTRALAQSAARAGYQVTAADAFADLDLRRVADVIPLRPEYGTRYHALSAAAVSSEVASEMVAYTSNFENFPAAVAQLATGRRLLGNAPPVLIRARNPLLLARVLRERGFATPQTRATPPAGREAAGCWLVKPRRSGGGHGTAEWNPGRRVRRTHYLQQRISGQPGSVLFAADGRRTAPLALSRQLVGDAHFGATGFRYCGSLLGAADLLFPGQRGLADICARLATSVVEEFGLTGLNGVDFIAQRGCPYPIEVNPRYSASMELLERGHRISLFEAHARACQGHLPAPPTLGSGIEGKAIVFARRNVTVGDTRRWLQRGSYADIPHPGERIFKGRPICTVFARAGDPDTCYRLLVKRAAGVYRAVDARRWRAA